MDVFFKWCAACERGYAEVEYSDDERFLLAQVHDAYPDWTLEQIVDHVRDAR